MHLKHHTPLYAPPIRRALGMAGVAVLLTLAGCADMSGIDPHAQLRQPDSVGLPASTTAPSPRTPPPETTAAAQCAADVSNPRT